MLALMRVYETLGYCHWELELTDPDRDGKLTRIQKGSFLGDGLDDLERARAALQQAWKQAGRHQDNRRGQLPG